MITIPIFTPEAIRAIEVDFGTTIAQGIWKKMANHLAWIDKNIPIGIVIWFYDSAKKDMHLGGVNVNDPKMSNWQWCNGGAITNPNSPMVGYNTPNLIGLAPKAGLTIGVTGGITFIDLNHNHGGLVSYYDDTLPNLWTDDDPDMPSGNNHSHDIAYDLVPIIPINPPHIELQAYMRIA